MAFAAARLRPPRPAVLLGPAVYRRSAVAGPVETQTFARARASHRPRTVFGLGGTSPPRRALPKHSAVEPHYPGRRIAGGSSADRFWPRGAQRAERRRAPTSRGRRALPVARTSRFARLRCERTGRPLFGGGGVVRDARRPQSVSRRHGRRGAITAHDRQGSGTAGTWTRDSSRAGRDRRAAAAEGSPRPLSNGRGGVGGAGDDRSRIFPWPARAGVCRRLVRSPWHHHGGGVRRPIARAGSARWSDCPRQRRAIFARDD